MNRMSKAKAFIIAGFFALLATGTGLIVADFTNQPPQVTTSVSYLCDLDHAHLQMSTATATGVATTQWIILDQPLNSTVDFEDRNKIDTHVCLDTVGSYTFLLTGYDDDGNSVAQDSVTVTVEP